MPATERTPPDAQTASETIPPQENRETYLLRKGVRIVADLAAYLNALSKNTGQAIKGQGALIDLAIGHMEAVKDLTDQMEGKASQAATQPVKLQGEQASFCHKCGASFALHAGKGFDQCPS